MSKTTKKPLTKAEKLDRLATCSKRQSHLQQASTCKIRGEFYIRSSVGGITIEMPLDVVKQVLAAEMARNDKEITALIQQLNLCAHPKGKA